MMIPIEIDTALLQKSISEIETEIASITAAIKETYDGVKVLDSMWSGPANESFNAQFEADHQRLLEICSSVSLFKQRLCEAQKAYIDGENTVASIVDAIRL